MEKTRRRFMQTAGWVSAGALLLPQWACDNPAAAEKSNEEDAAAEDDPTDTAGSLSAFGIQLYTLRDIIGDDPKGTLRQLADYGYTQIESYEGPQGMFWGMSPTEFKTYLDSIGLTAVSSHCDIYKDFETKAVQAAEIGMPYLVCPYLGAQDSKANWQEIADKFNECGEICRKHGIRFAYHNHAYSFEEVDGIIPQDFVMQHTDPATVDYEMDIYWVVTAGEDPAAWLEKYPDRFRLSHVKDRMRNVPATEEQASTDLGTGTIDFATILEVAAAQGMEYFIMEQERYDNSTPMQSARVGADYLRQLRF